MNITYKRHEFARGTETRNAPLLVFVYDIPYMDACGIFPPLHILNIVLLEGGDEGGMSPGATWKPFALNEEQYAALVAEIVQIDPSVFGDQVRYAYVQFNFDNTLDHITDRSAWYQAACAKPSEQYLQKVTQGKQ